MHDTDEVVPNFHKLTRRKVKETDELNKAEFKQLDQYDYQETFGPPCERPPEANISNLL